MGDEQKTLEIYYECDGCCQIAEGVLCELTSQCKKSGKRLIRLYKEGDIVIDDYGNELVITSGNYKYAERGSVYDLSINISSVRARRTDFVSTQLFPTDDEGDFIWYERRIIGKKEEVANVKR